MPEPIAVSSRVITPAERESFSNKEDERRGRLGETRGDYFVSAIVYIMKMFF